MDWSLYRGLLPPLLTSGLISSINFALFEKIKSVLERDDDSKHISLKTVFIAGSIAGGFISLMTTPIGLIKVQQQTVSTKGLFQCISYLYKNYGIKGFYKGYGPMFIMESFGRGVYLWTYEYVKRLLEPENQRKDNSMSTKIIAASSAGCFSWASVYPLDVIKSRVQADIGNNAYKSSFDCLRQTWNEGESNNKHFKFYGGIRALTRGLGFTLLRAAPVASMVLPVYDSVYYFLEGYLVV